MLQIVIVKLVFFELHRGILGVEIKQNTRESLSGFPAFKEVLPLRLPVGNITDSFPVSFGYAVAEVLERRVRRLFVPVFYYGLARN